MFVLAMAVVGGLTAVDPLLPDANGSSGSVCSQFCSFATATYERPVAPNHDSISEPGDTLLIRVSVPSVKHDDNSKHRKEKRKRYDECDNNCYPICRRGKAIRCDEMLPIFVETVREQHVNNNAHE